MPNRPTRRRTARSGPRPASGDHRIPHRIPNAYGKAVTLGGQPYHLSVLTAAGTAAFNEWFAEQFGEGQAYNAVVAYDGMNTARTIVDGVLRTRAWGVLYELLAWAIAEEVPNGSEQGASADELEAVIEAHFDRSGLRWYDEVLKNSRTRAEQSDRAIELLTRLAPVLERMMDGQAVPALPRTTIAANPPGDGAAA